MVPDYYVLFAPLGTRKTPAAIFVNDLEPWQNTRTPPIQKHMYVVVLFEKGDCVSGECSHRLIVKNLKRKSVIICRQNKNFDSIFF